VKLFKWLKKLFSDKPPTHCRCGAPIIKVNKDGSVKCQRKHTYMSVYV